MKLVPNMVSEVLDYLRLIEKSNHSSQKVNQIRIF